MTFYTRTCVLCDTKIKASQRLCTAHYKEYGTATDEPWFKELLRQQKRQDAIDRLERHSLPTTSSVNVYGDYTPPELLSKRPVGRPATDWRIVNKILAVYDDSVDTKPKSLRKIARAVDNKVDHCTVRNILKTYRPKDK